jgi:F420-non-reducing hydrogenase large subunit
MTKKITIDPITRLEGHGRIDIFLDDAGVVDDCFLVIPEIRGFEKFVEGRPVEELPRITSRICGVCPEAHHAASAKAVDAVYGVEIPPIAELIRRL